MSWIHKEYKKKAKALDREIKKTQAELRKVELEGYYSDREMDEKEQRIEQLKAKMAALEREKNRLWDMDKGGITVASEEDREQTEEK